MEEKDFWTKVGETVTDAGKEIETVTKDVVNKVKYNGKDAVNAFVKEFNKDTNKNDKE